MPYTLDTGLELGGNDLQRWASVARWLGTAVVSVVLTSFVFGMWYSVYAMSKLGAVFNPALSQAPSDDIILEAVVPSPFVPAAIISGLAMLVVFLLFSAFPVRAVSAIAPTALLVGAFAAWSPAAVQFASDRWQWPARSLNWMATSAPGELLAASVVTLVPAVFTFLLVRRSAEP